MKKRANKTQPKSVKRHSRRALIGVVTLALLLVGIVTALSKQGGQTQKAQAEERKTEVVKQNTQTPEPAKHNSSKHFVTNNAAGQPIVIDKQTGQTRPLTPQEAQTLAAGIKQLVNQSTDGLVQIRHENGMVSMDLQGHFQNVMLAKKEADGTISEACVNDLEAAADFFEIDPVLLGIAAPVSKSQPATSQLPIR